MSACMRAIGATPGNAMGNILRNLNNNGISHLTQASSLVKNLLLHRKQGHSPNSTSVDFKIAEKY